MYPIIKRSILTVAVGLTLAVNVAMAGESAQFKDLIGGDGIKAFDTMTARGFKTVETTSTPDGYIVTWWYNSKTGQCINTQSKDRVEVAEAGKHPKCDEAASQSDDTESNSQVASEPSKKAEKACLTKFGGKSSVKSFTALKPGWWEIILTGKKGRQVACTVNNSGKIDDWVDM